MLPQHPGQRQIAFSPLKSEAHIISPKQLIASVLGFGSHGYTKLTRNLGKPLSYLTGAFLIYFFIRTMTRDILNTTRVGRLDLFIDSADLFRCRPRSSVPPDRLECFFDRKKVARSETHTMKQILLALILAIAMPSIAAEQPADYCDDQASWQQWQQLLADNPQDNGITSLYAFRIGLCLWCAPARSALSAPPSSLSSCEMVW